MSTFPILYVADVPRAAQFYEQAFGFEQTYRWEDDGHRLHVTMPL